MDTRTEEDGGWFKSDVSSAHYSRTDNNGTVLEHAHWVTKDLKELWYEMFVATQEEKVCSPCVLKSLHFLHTLHATHHERVPTRLHDLLHQIS